MPITSSRLRSMTGKRECAVEMTCGMNFSTGSCRSMTSIWARGIMMSRTCISETLSAPSIMERASASSRLRSYAECSRRARLSRSSGSRRMSAERRSSNVGREGSFTWGESGGSAILCANRHCVRIGIAEPREDRNLAFFHALRVAQPFVTVAAQVQYCVHDQVRVVRPKRLLLATRLAGHDGMAKHDVAAIEREHVGRAIGAAIGAVQAPAFCRSHYPQRDLRSLCTGCVRERTQTRGDGHASGAARVLHRDGWCLPTYRTGRPASFRTHR